MLGSLADLVQAHISQLLEISLVSVMSWDFSKRLPLFKIDFLRRIQILLYSDSSVLRLSCCGFLSLNLLA